jgi:hypothetical protein
MLEIMTAINKIVDGLADWEFPVRPSVDYGKRTYNADGSVKTFTPGLLFFIRIDLPDRVYNMQRFYTEEEIVQKGDVCLDSLIEEVRAGASNLLGEI